MSSIRTGHVTPASIRRSGNMPPFRPLLEPLTRFGAAAVLAAAACGPGETPPPQADAPPPPPAAAGVRTDVEALETGAAVLLQAVSAVSDSVVWISGHQGTWTRTVDGGATWTTGRVPGHDEREFRDVHAFHRDTAVLLAAGPGDASRLFRTEDGGATWTETFVMSHPQGFLDCMDFWDGGSGLAYGDAVDGEIYLLRTGDGGRSWERVDPSALPPALPGEGGFAASGTCLRTGPQDRAWIATGNGERARLLATVDGGATWSVADLPLARGEARGATTVGFRPDGMGFALGGDLVPEREGSDTPAPRVALSADGGLSWSAMGDLVMPGAVYGAAWVPDREPATLFAVGPGGMDWSVDGGMHWTSVDTVPYWAVDFSDSGTGWAAGPGGRVVRIRLEAP